MEQAREPQSTTSDRELGEKLDKAGWGVALIWIGTAILLEVGWGAGLFGLGAIILAAQLLRRNLSLRCDWFALATGTCFCLAGMGPVLGDRLGDVALPPIWSVALGAVFLASAVLRRRPG